MNRFWASLRQLTVPAILVIASALLTVPWATWVIRAAYEHEVSDRAKLLMERVESQMSAAWAGPQQALDSIDRELASDSTIEAVCVLDEGRAVSYRARSKSVPIPQSFEEVSRMLNADPGSYRKRMILHRGPFTRMIYVSLSRSELNRHFWKEYWPLLQHVIAATLSGFVIFSSAGILLYRFWGRASRQKERAQLEQQGMLAERVLTAAVLAHEIRNPLAALRFQLHSLRRNAADAARVGSTADTIDAELMRIQQLVHNYLAHERAQSPQIDKIDLNQAARGLHTLMDELLRESGTRLAMQEHAGRVVAACDPHGLRQVLMNLIINAQQAMGHGGTITVSVGREEAFGTIAVSDTGPGIPPEMLDRLFKPFATSKQDGSGIGLALVKRFVDNFGGTISVESEPGRGASFKLKLPLAEPAKAGGEPLQLRAEVEGLIR